MAVHDEASFEAALVADLVAKGWEQGAASGYNPSLGLDTGQLMTFLGATQAKAFDKLIGYHGSQEKAQRKVAKRIAAEIDARGASMCCVAESRTTACCCAWPTSHPHTRSRPSCRSSTRRTA